MRSLRALGAIAVVCLAAPSHAQNPFHHKKEIAVVALHLADAITTHEALSNPCHCFREENPLAPHSGSWGTQIGFHMGIAGLAIGGAYWFRHHGVPKYGNFVLWESIGIESAAVTSNAIVSAKE
jgi:hypothetical protein